jgi:hypothetical protein
VPHLEIPGALFKRARSAMAMQEFPSSRTYRFHGAFVRTSMAFRQMNLISLPIRCANFGTIGLGADLDRCCLIEMSALESHWTGCHNT